MAERPGPETGLGSHPQVSDQSAREAKSKRKLGERGQFQEGTAFSHFFSITRR